MKTRWIVKDGLAYDPIAGVFVNTEKRSQRTKIGGFAGNKRSLDGYCVLRFNSALTRSHRLAWYFVNGEWPPQEVDHKNRCRSDNRIANLRMATRAENNQNTTVRVDNKTGVRGVHYRAKSKRYIAQICINGRPKHIGTFTTLASAAEAYRDIAARLHGEFFNETHTTA